MSRQVVEPIKDKGVLSLGFDNTPGKDPYFPSEAVTSLSETDVRFQGYPSNRMERPHVPRTYSDEKYEALSSRNSEALNELLNPPIQENQSNGSNDISDSSQEAVQLTSRRRGVNPYLSETEEEKIKRQQIEAANDIRRFKEEKQRHILEQQLQKKHDMHQLQTYDPWGRPGHGAPRGESYEDWKRMKLMQEQQQQQEQQQPESGDADGLTFNKPGNGAPIRTKSGRLVTQLQGDPLLRFQEVKKGKPPIEPIRYRNPQGHEYARELDAHMQQQAMQREFDRRHELMEEMETLQYNPYGKPGAGAPNQRLRVQKTVGRFENAQNSQMMNSYSDLHQYDPWGKGYGQPVRDGLGNVRRYPFHDKRDGSMLYPLNTEKYSFVNQTANVPVSQQQQQQQQQCVNHSEHIPPSHRYYGQQRIYDPFGKPGNGAPIIDDQGNVKLAVAGSTQFDENLTDREKKILAARIYSEELEQEMIEQNLNRKLEKQQRRAPEDTDLVEQLSRGAVGKPVRDPRTGQLMDHHLPSSDITHIGYKTPRHKFQSITGYQHLPSFVQHADNYGSELERAAHERATLKQLERMQEVQEAKQHAATFDQMFGKPGSGAPYEPTIRKLNLPEVLHHPLNERNEFRKAVDHVTPVHNTVYVRNNVHSTHENNYEASNELTPYQLASPIAHPDSRMDGRFKMRS